MMDEEKIVIKILKKLGIIEKREISKNEMCESAKRSGICPDKCDTCAWNIKGE